MRISHQHDILSPLTSQSMAVLSFKHSGLTRFLFLFVIFTPEVEMLMLDLTFLIPFTLYSYYKEGRGGGEEGEEEEGEERKGRGREKEESKG